MSPRRFSSAALLVAGYLWASPATAVGMLVALLALPSGGRIQFVRGAIEAYGGWVTRLLQSRFVLAGGCSAMTLGHVILGQDLECLAGSRDHEHVHVAQYRRWGPFFLPAYFAAALWLRLRGKNPYWDNPFERAAYDREK